VIEGDEVKIVDEFTGRIMEGRRWSEGLHQAVEAKEGVRIQEEHLTLATITLQNYFRLYDKLGGMTGTAKTEEKEFVEIYNLHVVEIPTNVQVARLDKHDLVFKTKQGKFEAVARDIKERVEKGQPVLVGTIAVETSEYLSALLNKKGVRHTVLNAKEHAREAEIIVDAGQRGAVTIATNMAGRGVDIKLGEGVTELGGLYVLGTERHESRRIDNQLRGRSGRQGDPGETRFYLSGEDDLVRLFAGDRIKGIMERFKIPDDQPMEAKILSRQIEGAQKKVEEQNFVMRKNVLKYDDVLNRHRGRIYEQRRQVLEGDDMSEQVKLWIDDLVEDTVNAFTEEQYGEEWDLEALTNALAALYPTEITAQELREDLGPDITRDALIEEFQTDARDEYVAKEEQFGPELMRELERFIILQVVDVRWREHLENMDYLREGVHLRSMAQKDPLVEYTSEGERMFTDLGRAIRGEVVLHLFHAELAPEDQSQLQQAAQPGGNGGGNGANLQYESGASQGAEAIAQAGGAPVPATGGTQTIQASPHEKLGRNEPCWCGSGKKFKKCHGA
jgi:preprotein translocase subunit SecA